MKKLKGIEGALKQHEAFKKLGVKEESLAKLTVREAVVIMENLNNLLSKHNLELK